MDGKPDEAADDGAVDADELQVAADGGFEFFGDGARVPLADGLLNEADDLITIIVDEADGGTAQVEVYGGA